MSEFTPSAIAPSTIAPQAWRLLFLGSQLLVRDPEKPSFVQDGAGLDSVASRRLFIGRLGQNEVWVLSFETAPPQLVPIGLRAAIMQIEQPFIGIASRAAQLVEWDRAHRFCGVCGTLTEVKVDEHARVCPACKHAVWPRISPAMMALVTRGKEILLARQAHFAPGYFSVLAGFVEAGESLEACVHREVQEEVGLRIHNLNYFGSQSWPFPHSLMLAFTAEWLEGDIAPQDTEIEAAHWFHIDALPKIPTEFTISGILIRSTIEALRK